MISMDIRVGLLGGDELVRRGLDSMLRTLGGFELGTIKDRARLPLDIALVETFGTARGDTTLQRAVADPHIRRVAFGTAYLIRLHPEPTSGERDADLFSDLD